MNNNKSEEQSQLKITSVKTETGNYHILVNGNYQYPTYRYTFKFSDYMILSVYSFEPNSYSYVSYLEKNVEKRYASNYFSVDLSEHLLLVDEYLNNLQEQ